MCNRIVSLTTLVAFVIYTLAASGCTKVVTRSGGWRFLPSQQTKVTALKLKDGQQITYNSTGATYQVYDCVFSGTAIDGNAESIRLDQVDFVFYISSPGVEPSAASAERFGWSHRQSLDRVNRKRADVGEIRTVFTADSTVTVNSRLTRMDIPTQAIVGVTNEGTVVNIPLSEVDSLTTSETHGELLVIYLGLMALAVVIIDNMEIISDDWDN